MRILISTHHRMSPDSGAPGTGLALGNAFAELGHGVRYLSFDNLPQLSDRVSGVIYPEYVAWQLRRRRYREIDVIDASTGDTWLWASLRRRHRGPLLVTRSHGLEHLFEEHTAEHARLHGVRISIRHKIYAKGWRQREVRRSMLCSDLVLALNWEERDYAIERLGIDPQRIEIVANGLDERFCASASRVNLTPGARSIAYVGAYREMKGVEYASEALVEVMRQVPDVTVSFLGGEVPREQVLSRFPADLHARIATVECYRRQDLPQLLEGHGILLFPSLSEGFGNALVEGMACGLAPVAARSAGAEQIVSAEQDGLLVPRFDAAAMARETLRLLDSRELRERLQGAARGAAERYAMEGVATRTLSLYERAIERRQGAGK
jgi:glycosyltransferase involved in cell wall biosynthesis